MKLIFNVHGILQRHQKEQMFVNNRLMEEVSELQQEALLIREIPRRLCESVTNCKDIYKDVVSTFQVKYMHHVCFSFLNLTAYIIHLYNIYSFYVCDPNRTL